MIHIAITINEDFIIPACVMLTSLLENNSKNPVHVHVLTNSKSYKLQLLKRTLKRYKCENTFHVLSKETEEKISNFCISAHADFVNYYRIFLPEILDNSIEKVLYLDVDMIINADISELYNTDISAYALAAADEENENAVHLLNIPFEYNYFNSGVLLMNLKKFREENTIQKLSQFILENEEKLFSWDQDAFNAVLYKDRFTLDHKWNVTLGVALNLKETQPNIVHYTGMHKAWHPYYCQHPYKQLYFDYLKKDTVLQILNKFFAPKSHR
ncbi:MAG: glycosyltransferase family 8 protein [Chitinophagales bacterium]